MYAYQTQDQFDDFYDSLHDNNENEYGFGKMVNQVSSNKKMPKASSYQTIKSAFSAEKPFAKKISETSFKNLDQDKTNTVGSASPVKFSKIIEQPTASTMASFNSVNSINSQSNSHISIGNSNSQNVISAEKKKSKNKSKNKKKKQQSKNNNSHLNSKKKNVSTENDFKVKYKTEQCKYWSQTGSCPFGDSCAFAHGQAEARDKLHISSNYKTKKCVSFHTTGYCPYGMRCQFIHSTLTQSTSKVTEKLNQQSYQSFLELADIVYNTNPDCFCFRQNKNRLPALAECSYAGFEDESEEEDLTQDMLENVKKYSDSSNDNEAADMGFKKTIFEDESSDSSF